MSAAAASLLWGKVFAHFNTKWTYIISVLLFEVGSALCGGAPNMDTLIVGRAWSSAPLIGEGFAQSSVGWRWAFYINLVVGAACAPVYLFLIPNIDPRKGAGLMGRAREIDVVGGTLNIGAFGSGTMAISFGGITWAWGSAHIIALFICSGVLFALLAIQQISVIFTTAERRLVPVEFFKSRTMLMLFAATSAARTATFIPIYMIPLFFQFTRGEDAFDTGVRLLPFIVLCIFAIVVNGAAMSAFGYYMPWYTVGGALVLIGGALFYSTVDTTTPVANIYGYSAITGLGSGMYLQTRFSIAQASVERTRVTDGSSFITCSQVVGSTIALAIANSVFLNEAQDNVVRILPDISRQEVQTVISGASELVEGLTEDLRREVEEGIVSAMGDTYIPVITAGALTLVLSLFMKMGRLFKK
ncbi:major facilitator superfamily domain-containing protein [Aspergillus pseudoustus]|uniref:Major facilitator superfamily domain-containing protein n=1 Tax=Aspergillus pseudoustus TaxID=1810923 RepID=A0ABR4J503_9EURO